MNLLAIRNNIAAIVDYNPEVQEYTDEITRMVNDVYIQLFNEHSWKFAEKTAEIEIFADATSSGGILFAGSQEIGSTTAIFQEWMEGATIEVSGSANADGEWTIAKRSTSTTAYIEEADWPGGTDTGVTFVVKQRYIDLPSDCVNIISTIIRDYQDANTRHVLKLPRIYDEVWRLSTKTTGTPHTVIPHEDYVLPGPMLAPTLVDGGAGANGVPVAGEWEVAYTYIFQNRESSLSPAAAITMASGDEIDISALVNTGLNSGYEKKLYFKAPNTEAFYAAENLVIDEVTTTAVLQVPTDWPFNAARAPEHDGVYKRIRLYPRQADSFPLVVRYTYLPTLLTEDADTPEMPVDSHKYLVYRTCEELFVKHNNLSHSELYRRRADKDYVMMQNRHLNDSQAWWVKRHFTIPTNSIYVSTAGTLTRV